MAQRLIDRYMLGLRIHTLRFATRLSAKESETRLTKAISESTLLRWEQAEGDSYPDPAKLALLCEFFSTELGADVQVGDLLDPDFDTRVWLNAAA